LLVIGWITVCYVSWCGLAQFVFVTVCGAWAVYRDRVFFTVCSGDGQLVDSEEMFALCGKKIKKIKNVMA